MNRIGNRPKAMARISLLIVLGFAVGLLLLPRLLNWAQADPPMDTKDAPEKTAAPTPSAPSAPAADKGPAPAPSPEPPIGPPHADVFVESRPSVPAPATEPTAPIQLTGSIPPPSINPPLTQAAPVDELQKARDTLKELAIARQKKQTELKDIEKLYAAAQAKLNEVLQTRLKVLEDEANALRAELKAQHIPPTTAEPVPAPQAITGSASDDE